MGKVDSDHDVQRIRYTATHQVAQLLIQSRLIGKFLQCPVCKITNTAQLLVPISILLTRFDNLTANESCSFGYEDYRIITGIGAFVCNQEAC